MHLPEISGCGAKKEICGQVFFHNPGVRSIRADQLSRAAKKLNQDMEWALDPNICHEIQKKMGFVALICLHLLKIINNLFTVHTYQTTRLWQ